MIVRFSPLMRLLCAVFCIALATTLMGATSSLLPPTTLVIFPFRQAEGLDPQRGLDYVSRLGATLKDLGGVNVVMGDPATAQADFLHVAKAAGADYYLIGFVAPPTNNMYAVIEQIVSARSGTVVWSNTAHIGANADVIDQAPVIKNALVAYSSRGYYAVLNPTPKPSPAPSSTAKKNGVSVGGGGGGGAAPKKPLDLPNEAYGFSSGPTAPPKLYASASNPSRFVVVASTGKLVPPVIRDYTTSSLIIALKRHGQTAAQGNPDTTVHWIFRGHDICTDTGAAFLVSGSVSTKSLDPTRGDGIWTDAYVNVALYDCAAQKFEQSTKPMYGGAFSWKTAVDNATNTAVKDYLLKISASVAHS
jgi:TolB-like protein